MVINNQHDHIYRMDSYSMLIILLFILPAFSTIFVFIPSFLT